jgi:hypothetical protein
VCNNANEDIKNIRVQAKRRIRDSSEKILAPAPVLIERGLDERKRRN